MNNLDAHHLLCNDPDCPSTRDERQIRYPAICGTSYCTSLSEVSDDGNRPGRTVAVLMRYTMIHDSFCVRLELLRGSNGEFWVRDFEHCDIWLEQHEHLGRTNIAGTRSRYPPTPDVELMFAKAGLQFDHRLAQYWNEPELLDMAHARIEELLAHERYAELCKRVDRRKRFELRSANSKGYTGKSAREIHEMKRAENQRREVDESFMPEAPRGRSSIFRKSKERR